jgi:hypothetical protein
VPTDRSQLVRRKSSLVVAGHLYFHFIRKQIIYRKARAAPKIEYSELVKAGTFVTVDGTPLKPPSRSTLYRCLKRLGLTKFPCKKRPKLNRGHALKRLQFCRQYRNFQWARRTLKFSDGCSLQKGAGNNQEWCFRSPWEKWKPEMITTIGTGRKPAQMVWASVWLDERGRLRRSKLVIMKRDPQAKKKEYSSKSYIEAHLSRSESIHSQAPHQHHCLATLFTRPQSY